MSRWYKSIYLKLFIAFIVIILPLQLTQFSMYNWGKNAVTDELKSAASSNVVYLRDNFVSNIKAINVQLEYLLNNNIINSFFVNHNHFSRWEYYSTAKQVINLLSLIKNSNPYISEIILYYTTYDIVISSDNKIENTKTDNVIKSINDFRNQHSLFVESNGKMMVGHMIPITTYYNEKLPQYFVQAILSEDTIKAHLSSFSQYSNKNALMIIHNTGTIITSNESTLDNTANLSLLLKEIVPQGSEDVYSTSLTINNQPYIVVACYSKLINASFVQLIMAETLQTIPKRFEYFMKMFFVLAFVVIAIFSLILYRLVKRPIDDLMNAFSLTGEGNFNWYLTKDYDSYEYNELASHFNNMISRIKRLIQTNYEQTIRLQHSELKQLQAQINPHFLYNSFFLLRHMIGKEENEQAKLFTSYLGKYFQYITKSGMDMVPLKSEYEHAINYLTIQMMRFEDKIQLQIQPLPEILFEFMVPKLILQPIFENTLIHGIRKSDCKSIIRLSFDIEDQNIIHIIIDDNGDQLTDDNLAKLQNTLITNASITESSGLVNIHKRLQLHFGEKSGLTVSRSELGGLKIDIKIIQQNPEEGDIDENL